MGLFDKLFKKQSDSPQPSWEAQSYTNLDGSTPPGSAEEYDYPGDYAQAFDGIDNSAADGPPPAEASELTAPDDAPEASGGWYVSNPVVSLSAEDAGQESPDEADWQHQHEPQSGKIAQPDYNFETPSSDPAQGPADAPALGGEEPAQDAAVFKGEIAGIEPAAGSGPGLRSDGELVQAAGDTQDDRVTKVDSFNWKQEVSDQPQPEDSLKTQAPEDAEAKVEVPNLKITTSMSEADSEGHFDGKLLTASDLTQESPGTEAQTEAAAEPAESVPSSDAPAADSDTQKIEVWGFSHEVKSPRDAPGSSSAPDAEDEDGPSALVDLTQASELTPLQDADANAIEPRDSDEEADDPFEDD